MLASARVFTVVQVSGNSMEPTLRDGDILLLMKRRKVARGEMCCFSWQDKLLVKRIVGLPGDRVVVGRNGDVFVNGKLLDEPYISEKSPDDRGAVLSYNVGKNRVFLLGDNRAVSVDSRAPWIGCVETSRIAGKVVLKLRRS